MEIDNSRMLNFDGASYNQIKLKNFSIAVAKFDRIQPRSNDLLNSLIR